MNREKRVSIFTKLRIQNPHPKTELHYSSPFELLIAVILSAQVTDIRVNKVTKKLYSIANTPQAIFNLGVDKLKEYIKSVGLFHVKANNIIKTCQILLNRHGGTVPNTRETLQALPGVGRKTVNIVLNIIFKQPTMAVDTHIFRVSNRTGLALGKNVLEVEKRLIRLVPREFLQNAHHWLIIHGRYICKAKKPKCSNCIIKNLCEFKKKS